MGTFLYLGRVRKARERADKGKHKITVMMMMMISSRHMGKCVAFPGGSNGKASARNAGDLGSIPGLGRSPGEGKGYPLQYSCLENSTDRGAW